MQKVEKIWKMFFSDSICLYFLEDILMIALRHLLSYKWFTRSLQLAFFLIIL